MDTPSDPAEAIQPGPPAPPTGDAAKDSFDPPSPPGRGLVTGFVSGLVMGPVAGAASCWINASNDYLLLGVFIGTVIGIVVGPVLGWMESLRRPDISRSDTATFIGAAFGLVPGFQLFLFATTAVRGRWVLIGTFFVGPMIGMLIGALLDRVFDARRNRLWRDVVVYGALTLAAAGGLIGWMIVNPGGENREEITRAVRTMMIEEWHSHPATRSATIQNVTLVRVRDSVYTARVEATVAGQKELYHVDIEVEPSTIHAKWRPIDE